MSRRRNGSTRSWRQLRAWCLDRDAWRCQAPDLYGVPAEPGSWAALHAPADWPRNAAGRPMVCGAYAHHGDHVVPWDDGGADDPANVRANCEQHNLSRGKRPDTLTPAAPPTTTATTRWSWE